MDHPARPERKLEGNKHAFTKPGKLLDRAFAGSGVLAIALMAAALLILLDANVHPGRRRDLLYRHGWNIVV